MKVLIACEFSGVVRKAFTDLGYDAISCDLEPSELPGKHYIGDVRNILNDGFDLLIAHPPCTYLAISGARYMNDPVRQKLQLEAVKFFMVLYQAPIKFKCLENPVGVISSYFRKPDQYIQPYEYGHYDSKKTGLWLKNLPLLKPTRITNGRLQSIRDIKKDSNRQKNRSRTYKGIAAAIAKQYGDYVFQRI